MQFPKDLTRAQRALRTAQLCVAESVFQQVTDRLRSEPCVAFALVCGHSADWSPEVDIAVRLLSIARHGRPVDQGHLIWGLAPHQVRQPAVESGRKAVAACVSLLRDSGQPFEFLAHVEGNFSIEIHCEYRDAGSRFQQLADAIADEVLSLCGDS